MVADGIRESKVTVCQLFAAFEAIRKYRTRFYSDAIREAA